MSFLSKLRYSNLVQAVRDFLFSKKTKKSAEELVQLWTAYRKNNSFSELCQGTFPKPSENGIDGQQKGIYFWNQKAGPFAWLKDGGVYLDTDFITLMASTVLKKSQLSWPDWKIDAVLHKDLLRNLLVGQKNNLWKEQGHDIVYPINQKFVAYNYDFDPLYNDATPHLTHSVLVAKDGIHIRDEEGHFGPKDIIIFDHKCIKDFHLVDKDSYVPTGALERAIDCLCQNNLKFRAAYDNILQQMPYKKGLRAVKYCADASLPVAIIRSVIYGSYSKVEFTNPVLSNGYGKVMGERKNETFLGELSGDSIQVSLDKVRYHEKKCKVSDLPVEYELAR